MPADATWRQAGVRTQALDVNRQQLGLCPYPLRLTLLRWQAKDKFQHSTLISFSDAEELPTADLCPTYHQRQDVEAGIKQGKGTFSFTKLRGAFGSGYSPPGTVCPVLLAELRTLGKRLAGWSGSG